VDVTFAEASRRTRERVPTTELDIQDFIWSEFESRGLSSSHRPIVAVNAHSADPHYQPDRERNLPMVEGDFLLLDIWAKRKLPTRLRHYLTGYLGRIVPEPHQNILMWCATVDAAIRLVQSTILGVRCSAGGR
jgi:hypothetical protein